MIGSGQCGNRKARRDAPSLSRDDGRGPSLDDDLLLDIRILVLALDRARRCDADPAALGVFIRAAVRTGRIPFDGSRRSGERPSWAGAV